MIMHKAGTVFNGPDGQGYTLRIDVEFGQAMRASDLAPFGGAPQPKEGEPSPTWLRRQLQESTQ